MKRLILFQKPVRAMLLITTLLIQIFALSNAFAFGRRAEREIPRRERSDSSKGSIEQRQREHDARKERGRDSKYHNYYNPPKSLPAFPDTHRATPKTRNAAGKLRARWKDSDSKIYEWDYESGAVERYNRRGKHEGEFDHITGKRTKDADPSRSVEP
ncbi:colicin E3/pyocin S6 family cytotoxin [Rhodospirillum sp. A1_3_36]|uniref:colicin E3/pyocin S6 family cytotoxin n=1 Tax=Rhodospirillum sp. A1_3_36 TaxID=3391666 RepID=UPI0039A65110